MTISEMFKEAEQLYTDGKMDDDKSDRQVIFEQATSLLHTANICVRLEILANEMGELVKLQTELVELLKAGTLVYPTPTS